MINQDQYRAKADKARAQLKKDEAQALKAKRDLERIRPLYAQNAASQLDLDNAQAAYETAEASVAMSQVGWTRLNWNWDIRWFVLRYRDISVKEMWIWEHWSDREASPCWLRL